MSDQAQFARALMDPQLRAPTGLRAWNGSDPAMRFAVYRNNVIVSLLDALADTFPVVQCLVGEDFFRAMARVYLHSNPVKTRVLTWIGNAFPDFIAAFEPASSLRYLADVARLEILRVQAYHAADIAPVSLQILAQALNDPESLAELKLKLHPSVQLLASRYAVYSLWAAHQGALSISMLDPELAQSVLIYRRELDVEVVNLSPAQGQFLGQLMARAGFASAAQVAAEQDSDFDLAAFLATLIQLQLITDID